MQDGTGGASADGLSAAVDASQSAAIASMKRSLVDASDVDAADVDVKCARNETDGL